MSLPVVAGAVPHKELLHMRRFVSDTKRVLLARRRRNWIAGIQPRGRHLNAPVCQPASASQRPRQHVPPAATGETLELQVVVLANDSFRPLVQSSEANLHLLKRQILWIPGGELNHNL